MSIEPGKTLARIETFIPRRDAAMKKWQLNAYVTCVIVLAGMTLFSGVARAETGRLAEARADQGKVQINESVIVDTAMSTLANTRYANLMEAVAAEDIEAAVRSTASELLQRSAQVELPGRDTRAVFTSRLVGAVEPALAK
jgi:hypothetical protein